MEVVGVVGCRWEKSRSFDCVWRKKRAKLQLRMTTLLFFSHGDVAAVYAGLQLGHDTIIHDDLSRQSLNQKTASDLGACRNQHAHGLRRRLRAYRDWHFRPGVAVVGEVDGYQILTGLR